MKLENSKENNVPLNTVIFEGGEDVYTVAVLTDGSVSKISEEGTYTIEKGQFFALDDLTEGFYSGDYVAGGNCKIIPFECESIDEFGGALRSSKDALIAAGLSINSLYTDASGKYEALYKNVSDLYAATLATYQSYATVCKKTGISIARTFDFPNPDEFSLDLEQVTDERKQITAIKEIYANHSVVIKYLSDLKNEIVSNDRNCIFALVASLADSLGEKYAPSVAKVFLNFYNRILAIDNNFKAANLSLNLDISRVKFIYNMSETLSKVADFDVLISGKDETKAQNKEEGKEEAKGEENKEYKNIYQTIMQYAEFDDEYIKRVKSLLDSYVALPDKSLADDNIRVLRKNLNNEFYIIYEKVFLKYAKTGSASDVVKTFLDFGLGDERLVRSSTIEAIKKLETVKGGKTCTVWHLREWLLSIYNGKTMPSKNEFDEEYMDMVRRRKKEEHLSAEEENKLLTDGVAKAKYEIVNMFKYCHRLLNGAPTTFCAFLSDDSIDLDFNDLAVTADIFNAALQEVVNVDYSAFFRETMYEDAEKGILKEMVQTEVYPDVILFPCFGNNGLVWQDISGKRIINPGRFVFPSFFYGDMNNCMIKIVARFRWELCKSAQGMAWNDITVPSLTSLYSDYVQFYRKNRDLSTEKKEELKEEIKRCRNSMREVFVTDYFLWIKYEAGGAMRLNKVARRMLATYCPFSKVYRDKVAAQPLFEEAMKVYNINRNKRIKELNMRLQSYNNKGVAVTDEIYRTIDFWEKM